MSKLSSRCRPYIGTAFALVFAWSAAPALSQGADAPVSEVEAEIAALEEQISAAKREQDRYQGGALAAIAALNLETMKLTRSVLEARLAAEESGAPIEIVVPAVKPDPDLADEILEDIQAQQERMEEVRSEAEQAGGLMAALALTRYETERLSLSQLRQAWYRARYGIAFPTTGAPEKPQAGTATAAEEVEEGEEAQAASVPAWADPDHPEIDYNQPIFSSMADQGFEIIGWWGVEHSRAEIDDSRQVLAVNVSDWGGSFEVNHPSLKSACIEGEARVIFDADTFLVGDFNTNLMPVTVRIGDAPAETQRWSELTSSQGVGLFGAEAEDLMRNLLGEEKVFLRLTENDGQNHDLSIRLAGAEEVFEDVASACQFSLLNLGRDDYRAIQSMLNAGGYDAGTPDGQWGPSSRAAMLRYQRSEGLPETGAPDRKTLERMGLAAGEP